MVGSTSLHLSTSAVSADGQNYITGLALVQGTSDGNSGPLLSFGVTHWIWHCQAWLCTKCSSKI